MFPLKLASELYHFRVAHRIRIAARIDLIDCCNRASMIRKSMRVLDSIQVMVFNEASASTLQCHGKKVQSSEELTAKISM